MIKNRFKPIYVDLDTGKWYVTVQNDDSDLKSLRVEVNTASNVWYVKHYRKTKKIYIQILEYVSNAEILPEKITLVDEDTIRIDFAENTRGVLNLILHESDFYNTSFGYGDS